MRSKKENQSLILRLIQLGWPYRFQAMLGWICLVILSCLIFCLAKIMIPLINISTDSTDAGERTWLRLQKVLDFLDQWLPAREWGQSFLAQIPDFLYIGPHKTPILFFLVGVGAVCALLLSLFQFLAYYLTHRVTFRALADIRKRVNNILIRQHLGFYDQWRSGELMSKIQNDIETLSLALTFIFNQAPRGIVLVTIGLIAAAFQAPELTLILIVMPIFILPLKKFGKKIKRSSRYTLKMRAEMSDIMHQQFGGIREIMSFKLEKKRQNIFNKSNESIFTGQMGVTLGRAMSRALVEGGGHLTVLFVVVFAVFLALRLGITFGEFTSFGFIVASLIWNPLRTLSRAYNNFQNALPGLASILSILDNPEPLKEVENAQSFPTQIEKITFKNVSYQYRKSKTVLDNINFEIQQGQVVALVGPTGSGKSTLVDFLPRFRDPTEGDVLINHINLKSLSLKDLRSHIAFVTQDPYIFNSSVRENLLVGNPKATEDELWEILKTVQLDELIKDKPKGLDFVVGERGSRLSGGQRQRLAIARALMKNAPLLVLDEATSAQDSVTESGIQKTLKILMRGKTTFIIAHKLSTARQADLILFLKDGQLIEKGNHEELRKLDGEYAHMYQNQQLPD